MEKEALRRRSILSKNAKRAALELSIGTIVILVLGVTMLIMGMVVTRSIMCGALGLTDDVNDKARSELNNLFSSTESEVACIGSTDPVKIVPGKTNFIHCSVKAPEQADYNMEATISSTDIPGLKDETIENWLTLSDWNGPVAPGDTDPKTPINIKLPENAPEGIVQLQLKISKDDQLVSTKQIKLEISRVGFVRSAAC